MKSNRRIVFVLISAIVCALAAELAFWAAGDNGDTKARKRFSLVDSSWSPAKISIFRRGENEAVLAKTSSWRLVEPYQGNVDEEAVLKLLDALALTEIDDYISDSELLKLGRTRRDFSLVNPRLSVELAGAGKRERISFGSLTPSGDGVYASVEGVSAVFAVPAEILAAVDIPLDRFRRRTLFRVTSESVVSFDVRRGGEILSFSRRGDGWTVGAIQAQDAKVKEMLEQLVASQAVDFVWPTGAANEAEKVSASLLSIYQLDPDSAVTVTLKCSDSLNRQVSFGRTAGEGQVYALIQNGGAIVTVPERLKEMASESVSSFVDARLFPVGAESVASFSIVDAQSAYAFVRQAAGGWKIDSPISSPADGKNVEAIVSRIVSLTAADVTDGEGVKVSVAGFESASVSKSAVMGELTYEDLRSLDILSVDPQEIKRLVGIAASADPVAVAYDRELKAWTQESDSRGALVDNEAVAEILRILGSLKAVRVEKLKVNAADLAAMELEKPVYTLAVDSFAEKQPRRNIMFGKKLEDGSRYATVGASDAVFVISGDIFKKLSHSLIVK